MRHYDAPIMGAVCALIFSMLFIAPLARIVVMVVISLLLIVLLTVMVRAWGKDHYLLFDGIVVGGAFLTLLYMLSFMALEDTFIARMTLVMFAAFYLILAVIVAHHVYSEEVYSHARVIKAKAAVNSAAKAAAKASRPKRHFLRRIFRRHDPEYDSEFKKGMTPLHDLSSDEKSEEKFFRKGVEPIPELHHDSLHPDIEVYDAEELEQELKNIEQRAKKKR